MDPSLYMPVLDSTGSLITQNSDMSGWLDAGHAPSLIVSAVLSSLHSNIPIADLKVPKSDPRETQSQNSLVPGSLPRDVSTKLWLASAAM
ncbi:hypothetical protein RRF57_001768 [Xylaria bambusicola]|uniref:Uncharacterized protein n=1 Tax=Xylaria bambusicola TaxID=326684 RepID=A0AAN7UCH1_9PEZI